MCKIHDLAKINHCELKMWANQEKWHLTLVIFVGLPPEDTDGNAHHPPGSSRAMAPQYLRGIYGAANERLLTGLLGVSLALLADHARYICTQQTYISPVNLTSFKGIV